VTRPPRSDALLAAALVTLSVAQVLIFPITSRPLGVAMALVATLPIAWRRIYPVAAPLVGTAIWWIRPTATSSRSS
jgi:hypothetical protein